MSKYYLGIDIAKLKFDAALLFDNKYKTKAFGNNLEEYNKAL